MLTSILILLGSTLTLLLLVSRVQAKGYTRRQKVYICDVCDSRDCLCREKN